MSSSNACGSITTFTRGRQQAHTKRRSLYASTSPSRRRNASIERGSRLARQAVSSTAILPRRTESSAAAAAGADPILLALKAAICGSDRFGLRVGNSEHELPARLVCDPPRSERHPDARGNVRRQYRPRTGLPHRPAEVEPLRERKQQRRPPTVLAVDRDHHPPPPVLLGVGHPPWEPPQVHHAIDPNAA